MSGISRRELLCSGLVLSASPLVARSAWARTAALLASPPDVSAQAAMPPREQLLFDFGWKFQLGHGTDPARDLGFGNAQDDFAKTGEFGFSKARFDDLKWRSLNLPHDWAVELPFVRDEVKSPNGDESTVLHGSKPLGRRFPETSVGWYRREFEIPASDLGRRISVEFDGAFRDTLLFVNGCFIGRNDNGYAPFRFDLTDFLAYGAKNHIVARVDATLGDGWFYEGAGIYRHVWLTKTDPLHLGRWESTVRAELKNDDGALSLGTVVVNEGNNTESASVSWQILDPAGKPVAAAAAPAQQIAVDGSATFTTTTSASNPKLWSVETPNLYTAIVSVKSGDKTRDAERITFGVRTAHFDADKGFFLNGKPLKIQGTCNHQDHAGVGSALPDRLQAFRIAVLQGMGCNAVRTSHNMPAPEWVEACDRMGMMMMCETRQMSSSPEGMAQLEAMVKRYRNSPSIIIWSIGNEEAHLQNEMAEQGARIAAAMVRKCHELDPTRVVSAAVHGDNEKGLSNPLDIIGFNYALMIPDRFHKEHPTRPIFGSEEASAFSTRGVYQTDPLRNTVSAYDVNPAGWGETAEEWWTFYATREWAAGGFAWEGFDYRGEPDPYDWPSISSQYGIVDTCGFAGDEIPVWVYSNLDEVELIVNGKSAGRQKVPRLGHLEGKVRYEPGLIEAHGWKDGKLLLTEKRETTGAIATLRLAADRTTIDADGEDVAVLTVDALDSAGRAIPTASNLVNFKVSGEGVLIGVGNGDPNCHESDKEPKRSLFNGLAQVIVQSTRKAGTMEIEASTIVHGSTVTLAKVTIATKQVELRAAVELRQ